MRPAFHPRLVNSPFEDPGLFVPFRFENRALQFDLGDLAPLSNRDVLKIGHVFVSHTHMDHFIGFDRLLRLALGRDMRLHVFGPQGITANVVGKLSGYTWNLVGDESHPLQVWVTEVAADRVTTTRFRCANRFQPEPDPIASAFDGTLHSEPGFSVHAELLDHRVPCLGFSLRECYHINIDTDALTRLGLAPGPWLGAFKAAVYEGAADDLPIVARSVDGQARRYTMVDLSAALVRITPGQVITYITDAAFSDTNRRKMTSLAKDADHLFIEAPFLQQDEAIARHKYHLTAWQAGTIANAAGARRLTVFHFSPRYQGMAAAIEAEAKAAWTGS